MRSGSAREILEYLRSRLSDADSADASGRGKGGANFGGADAEVAYAVSVARGNGKLDLRCAFLLQPLVPILCAPSMRLLVPNLFIGRTSC